MTFAAQRIFALLAMAALLAGGSHCPCAAAASHSSGVPKTNAPATCHVPKACEDAAQSCCPHSEPADGTAAVRDIAHNVPAEPEPSPPCPCDHCNTHVAPAPPEVKSAAPVASAAVAPVLLDQSTILDTVATTATVTATPDVPPPRDRLTLYALHCSLLD